MSKTPRKRAALHDRFWPKVDVRGPDDCWPWLGSMDKGYGSFRGQTSTLKAHRVAYELSIGAIPRGLQIDHACHGADQSCPGGNACPHRRCCNPAHLEPVTQQENIARGKGGAHHAAKTHCPRGHAYDGENLVMWRGQRVCRECNRLRSAAWHATRVKAGTAQ